jgi:hypothetical protein
VDGFQRPVTHIVAARPRLIYGPARRFDASRLPAAIPGDVEEHAEMAANVQNAAALLVTLDC